MESLAQPPPPPAGPLAGGGAGRAGPEEEAAAGGGSCGAGAEEGSGAQPGSPCGAAEAAGSGPGEGSSGAPSPRGEESRSLDSLESFSNLPSAGASSSDLNSDAEEAAGAGRADGDGDGPAGAALPPASKERFPGQSVYHIKWVRWKEENTPVITQNENGPCPLLAIMNVLLLAWKVPRGGRAGGVRGPPPGTPREGGRRAWLENGNGNGKLRLLLRQSALAAALSGPHLPARQRLELVGVLGPCHTLHPW